MCIRDSNMTSKSASATAASAATLELERSAIADKLEFIDNQVKAHPTTKLDNAAADIYILELDHWKDVLDGLHKQVKLLKLVDFDDHKKDYFVLLASIQTIQHGLRAV